jgi:hypothetical protein
MSDAGGDSQMMMSMMMIALMCCVSCVLVSAVFGFLWYNCNLEGLGLKCSKHKCPDGTEKNDDGKCEVKDGKVCDDTENADNEDYDGPWYAGNLFDPKTFGSAECKDYATEVPPAPTTCTFDGSECASLGEEYKCNATDSQISGTCELILTSTCDKMVCAVGQTCNTEGQCVAPPDPAPPPPQKCENGTEAATDQNCPGGSTYIDGKGCVANKYYQCHDGYSKGAAYWKKDNTDNNSFACLTTKRWCNIHRCPVGSEVQSKQKEGKWILTCAPKKDHTCTFATKDGSAVIDGDYCDGPDNDRFCPKAGTATSSSPSDSQSCIVNTGWQCQDTGSKKTYNPNDTFKVVQGINNVDEKYSCSET